MGQDAMEYVGGGKPKFSKKQKREYAKNKAAADEAKAVTDPKIIKEGSKKFNEHVNKSRKQAGLPVQEKKPETPKTLPMWIDTKRYDTIEVKVDLSKEERDIAAHEHVNKKRQLEQIDIDRKARMASFKDQMDEVKAQMSDLSNKVTLGYEYRKFSCQLYLDFNTKERVYKDRENGKELRRSKLEADDYQMRLPV